MLKIGLISDAHGNEGAFVSGLGILETKGCDQIFFLGDAVGYLPSRKVLEILKTNGLPSILGNHEAMLLSGPPYRHEEIYQLGRCRALLTDDDLETISLWPSQINFDSEGRNIWLMHGAPTDLTNGYVYPDSDLDCYDLPSGSVTIMANTHRPYWRTNSRGAFFMNPGSCGMPRDCGDLGSVGILDITEMQAQILRYDISISTRQALRISAPIHQTVIDLFKRVRQKEILGNIYAT